MALSDRHVSNAELVELFGIELPERDDALGVPEQLRDALSGYLDEQNRCINAAVALAKSHFDAAVRSGAERESLYTHVTTADGTVWGYLPLGDDMANITSCQTSAETLNIPDQLDGRVVVRIEVDACSLLEGVVEIACPQSVLQVGMAAFRRNPSLRRVVYPAALATYDPTWTRECSALEEIVYPGLASRVDSGLFDLAPDLKRLSLGAGVAQIVPGAFSKSKLERIDISPENPTFTCDGIAVYTEAEAGRTLVCIACPVAEYAVAPGTVEVANKAASGATWLERIELPSGLQRICEYAFSRAGLAQLDCPASLQRIEERAFYNARTLEQVRLNEGLRYVGTGAFDGTAVTRLELPASIENIGSQIVSRKVMRFGDPEVGISIAPGATALEIDRKGGMYRTVNGVKRFAAMLDADTKRYEVAAGTHAIEERAFRRHAHIEAVVLPEGLESIGEAAFRDCPRLTQVFLPRSLRLIADGAFLNTSLVSLAIGPAVERIGEMAILSRGSFHELKPISLEHIEVDAANPRFYVNQGMLCERLGGGEVKVIVFTDAEPVVELGPEITQLGAYAFNNAHRLRELTVHNGIKRMGSNALNIYASLDLLRVRLTEPVAGQSVYELCFPKTDRSRHAISLALSMSNYIDLESILKHYDECVTNIQGFDARSNDVQIEVYDHARLMLERLENPVYMTKVNRDMYDMAINSQLEEICVAAARHDDRAMINQLVDFGYITAGNIGGCIDAVGKLQDAAMTGHLLEVKRQRFGVGSVLDFEL